MKAYLFRLLDCGVIVAMITIAFGTGAAFGIAMVDDAMRSKISTSYQDGFKKGFSEGFKKQ